MEQISRLVIFHTLPDAHRRHPLTKRVLGLNLAPFKVDPYALRIASRL